MDEVKGGTTWEFKYVIQKFIWLRAKSDAILSFLRTSSTKYILAYVINFIQCINDIFAEKFLTTF